MTNKTKPNKETSAGDTLTPQAPAEPSAWYEVVCPQIEIDHLICYRTHRLNLTKSRAEEINTLQPGSLIFIGV